jgi:hypothetical protein
MDLSEVFEYGQGYVALSRVRRLSGLHMLGWNARAFQVHPDILAKDEAFREASEEAVAAFAQIPETELLKMHENFVVACGGSLAKGVKLKVVKEKKIKSAAAKKAGVSTHEQTLEMFKLGLGVSEIATKRGFSDGTIISHIEKLFMDDKITKAEIGKIIPARTRPARSEIEKEFKKLGDGKLTPVFEKFKGKYPYEDLRLIRMLS